MYKLVILIEPSVAWEAGQDHWPEFLHLVESMPDLRREATSQVESWLTGSLQYSRMHELFFDSRQDAERALGSPVGSKAGAVLQQITGGYVTLFFADHKEDDIENIRKYKTDPKRA